MAERHVDVSSGGRAASRVQTGRAGAHPWSCCGVCPVQNTKGDTKHFLWGFLQSYVTLGVVTAVLAAPCATESAQPLTSGGAERLTPGAVCLISRLHCQFNPSSPRFVLGCFQATATRCMCGTERAQEHSAEVS